MILFCRRGLKVNVLATASFAALQDSTQELSNLATAQRICDLWVLPRGEWKVVIWKRPCQCEHEKRGKFEPQRAPTFADHCGLLAADPISRHHEPSRPHLVCSFISSHQHGISTFTDILLSLDVTQRIQTAHYSCSFTSRYLAHRVLYKWLIF